MRGTWSPAAYWMVCPWYCHGCRPATCWLHARGWRGDRVTTLDARVAWGSYTSTNTGEWPRDGSHVAHVRRRGWWTKVSTSSYSRSGTWLSDNRSVARAKRPGV
jgi:hypothetical protein